VWSPTELIVLNIAIENQIAPGGDLMPLRGKASTLFSISLQAGGQVRFYRSDLPRSIRRQIEALDPETALQDHEAVRRILDKYTSCDTVFAGKGYYFARTPFPAEYPDAVYRDGCYVILVDGKPVSWAWTADESERAAELAVETVPRYQRRGYARQVVAAWAAHVLGEGKVAFYSHEVGNTPSEALAHSLGAVQYAVVTTYSSKAASG
jgi:RimJ/RimL family protein N-acetyltransferase